MAKQPGYDGELNWAGSSRGVKSINFDWGVDMQEVTDMDDEGKQDYLATIERAGGTFAQDWDDAATPIAPGTTAQIKIYLDKSATKYLQSGASGCIISNVAGIIEVGGIVQTVYSFTVIATGSAGSKITLEYQTS